MRQAAGATKAPNRLVSQATVQAVIEGLTHRLVLRAPEDISAQAIGEEIARLVRAYLQVACTRR
jgi:transcriptional regulator NrdR family protein